jgi:DNA-binding NtrC family response regulator
MRLDLDQNRLQRIGGLIRFFTGLALLNAVAGMRPKAVASKAMEGLDAQKWPGKVREL